MAGVLLVAFNPSLSAQGLQTFEGTLTIVWGDPHPNFGASSEIRYSLVQPDGTTRPLQLTGHEGEAAQYFGKRVLVSARLANQSAPAITQPAVAVVDSIALSPNGQPLAEPFGAVLGTRRVMYLLVKFSDDVAVPHPPIFYTDMTNPDTPPAGEVFPSTLNGFFKKTSSNQFSWVGDVGGVGGLGAPGGWLTLPHPKSYYAPCGWGSSCALLGALADDATALGRAQGINFTNYDNINFVLSNDLDCCAWGGGYYSSVDSKAYGATWEPPWGQNVSTYAHELGHSIGLPHSGWVYYAYDSPWDVMSSVVGINSVTCGSYNSINSGNVASLFCSEPGDGYIAAHKDYLGWIPAANEVTSAASSHVTVSLEAGSLPLGSAVKMIKLCLTGFACTGSSARYLTVEARVKGLGTTSQYDNGIPGEGVIIHEVRFDRPAIGGPCFFNSQSGWAVPIDATPGDYDSVHCNTGGRFYPAYGLYNAQWTAGQTYGNTSYGLAISVVSRTGSTFQIDVHPLPRTTRKGDLDGDGKTDLLWRQTQTGDVAAWLMNGAAVTQSPVIAAGVALAWKIVGTGDLDGDGKADLLWRQTQTGDVAAWLMNGASVTQGPVIAAGVPLAWQIVGVGDLDGDGKADLVWRHTQTGDVAAWLMNGVTVRQGPVIATGVPLAWQIVGVGDLDGDGRADLVWRHTQTGDLAAWLMNGVTVIQGPIVAAGVPLAWQVAGLGDLDGDSKADLLWRQSQTGDVAAWLMNGAAVKQGPVVAAGVPLAWQIVGLGDLDGDGKGDLLWRQAQTGDLAVWLMDGAAVKQQPVVAPGVPLTWQVQQ